MMFWNACKVVFAWVMVVAAGTISTILAALIMAHYHLA